MRIFIIGFLCLLVSITLAAQEEETNETQYHVQDSVMIPTQSGTDIYAILVRKKTNTEPLPVILFYTTYYQGDDDVVLARRSADRDYVGILAYARGIRTDVSAYSPYEHEQTDIYDIIDWISRQSWCDGRVGMYGGSYTGFSQWSAVKKLHPALKTIVPQVAVMPGFDFPMQNNVQLGIELNWAHSNIYRKEPIGAPFLWDWYEKGFAYAKMDSALGYTNVYFQKWLEHPAYDDYWRSLVPTAEEYRQLSIPVLTTTGYFDGTQISAVEYFRRHRKYAPDASHYLVIGPYDHWGGQGNAAANLRGYAIDSVANVSMRALAFDWFDWVLKDARKPALLKDKVNFQVMGTNTWQHGPDLESMITDSLRLYLDKEELRRERPEHHRFREQTVDFADRESMNNYFHYPLLIDSLDSSNGLVYTSAPFAKDVIINGAFSGALTLAINKRDLDLSIAFYEQTAAGQYFLLSRYLGRASYAADHSQRTLLTPHKQERIPLRAAHIISKKIVAGSRLVVVVNVNKHPFEIINYGSGKAPVQESISDAGKPLLIKWYNDSYIEVPVWQASDR